MADLPPLAQHKWTRYGRCRENRLFSFQGGNSMKHVLVAFLVMCTSLLCVRTVQALTEQEYQALLEIPYFQQADKDLSSIWKEVYAELHGAYKKQVLADQRQWLKKGREENAKFLMEKKNLGIAEAYTVATYLRIGELSVIQYNNGSGSGYPRPDDYYADQMYEKAMDVIQKLGGKKSTGEEETIAADWNSLYITYLTWRGAPYPLQITVKQFLAWAKMKGMSCQWGSVDNHVAILNITAIDKVKNVEEFYRIVFETAPNINRAVVTRCLQDDFEFTGQYKDNIFLRTFIAAESERNKIPAHLLESTQTSAPQKPVTTTQVCGRVVKVTGLPAPLSRITMVDFDGNPIGTFYINEDFVPAQGYTECSAIAKPDAFICADVVEVTPNDIGCQALGVTEDSLRWIGNCAMPN